MDMTRLATMATNIGMVALGIYLFQTGSLWGKIAGGLITFGTVMYFARKTG